MHRTDKVDELNTLSDTELVRRARAGDDAAFRKLSERCFLTIRKRASVLVSSGAEMDDLMQEGLIALHQAVMSYDEDGKASFRTYSEVCIRNRMISAVRRENSGVHQSKVSIAPIEEAEHLPDLPETDPQNALIDRESLRELEEYLEKHLTKTESSVLNCYLSGMTYDETASFLGISRKSCDNAMQRVRRKLRER